MPKITELTPQDLQNLKNKTPLSLPDNPSSKGFSASQIKEKMSGGFIYLFEKLQTTIKELNNYIDSNDTDIITINTAITGINMALAQLQSQVSALGITDTNIENQISQINSSIQELNEKVNNIIVGTNFATKEDLQNVIEIAEGKTQTYVISYAQGLPEEEALMYVPYYDNNGNRVSSYSDLQAYLGGDWDLSNELVNNKFNSNTEQVTMYDSDSGRGYILANRTMPDGSARNVFVKTFDRGISFLNSGDIIIVQQTDVPDRWVSGGSAYKMETSKVDLSTVVHKTGDETIDGVKTFNNDVKVYSNTGDATIIFKNMYHQAEFRLDGYVFQVNATFQPYNVIPYFNDAYNVGTQTLRFKHLYLAEEISYQRPNGQEWFTGVDIYGCYYISRGGDVKTYLTSSEFQVFGDLRLTGKIKSTGEAQYKKVQCLTQDEYDALSTKDENVLYLIKE